MEDDEELNEYDRLLEFQPWDWPGRTLVEQDNMGDWNGWLRQFDGWLQGVLTDPDTNVESLAHAIAEAYITECREAGIPMPADFNTEEDPAAASAADEAAITNEFTTYLRIWQSAVETKTKDR